MKNTKKIELHHYKRGVYVRGAHSRLRGDYSGLHGCCTDVYGEISTELTGNGWGISGDCTGITGIIPEDNYHYFCDIDECKIRPERRKQGLRIEDVVIWHKSLKRRQIKNQIRNGEYFR